MTDAQPDTPPMATPEALHDLKVARAINQRRVQALGNGTPPMELGQFSMVMLRMDMILEGLLPEGTAARVNFEMMYEQAVSESLDQAFAAQRQAAIRMGAGQGPQGPSLIVPGR